MLLGKMLNHIVDAFLEIVGLFTKRGGKLRKTVTVVRTYVTSVEFYVRMSPTNLEAETRDMTNMSPVVCLRVPPYRCTVIVVYL